MKDSETKSNANLAITALVMGIISIVLCSAGIALWYLEIVALASSILATVLGAKSKTDGKGMAGMILGIIGIAFSLAFIVYYMYLVLVLFAVVKAL